MPPSEVSNETLGRENSRANSFNEAFKQVISNYHFSLGPRY